MLRGGIAYLIKRFLEPKPKQEQRKKMTTPQLTPEYLEVLKREYEYVSACLQYSTQKYRLLCNQGLNPNLVQEANNNLAVKKAELEIQIYFLQDFLAQ